MLLGLDISSIILISILFLLIIGIFWDKLSTFFHKRYTFFEVIFIIIYFIEQFVFLLCYNLYPDKGALWAGLIVLFLTTTFLLEKFLIALKEKKLYADRTELLDKNRKLEEVLDYFTKSNKEYLELLEKNSLE